MIKKISFFVLMMCFVFFSSCAKENAKGEFKHYKAIADALNKQCPTKIGDDIQLDAVEYIESTHTLQYVYSFTTMAKEDNTAEAWNLIEAATKEALSTEFKSQTNVEQFRKDKLNMSFVYRDKNMESLFTVILKPEEY
ncbi:MULTISPECIES: hypothetical protein [unclassified Treponema]|uniref:hypothetical protein n=1 Tax=unclassified Treponema TaxID=2638727 RepID=UPI0020A50C67|nr:MULTISPECIES: hypothetical protein [unclassified Treponema]UTC65893.1 hypothetical protein E4O06_07590 [Treponema sp. OMZ 789]UTC68621.1 hypothetical protein E4O01_07730 [Treponema sp. OMZ 790]UTC71351.1 hypothetical protein E4O02_07925 [Treponema sp. OMZ 791]